MEERNERHHAIQNMTDKEIAAITQADPDNPEWTEEDWDRMTSQRKHLSIEQRIKR